MRRSTAAVACLMWLLGCSSDPLATPPDVEGDAGAAGAADVGSGGVGGAPAHAAGAGGDDAEGNAGAAGARDATGGEGGGPAAAAIGYRLAGIAFGTFPDRDAGASAGSGGEGGAAGSSEIEGGAAGASARLPHIDRAECNFYLDFVDVIEDDSGGFDAFAIGEVFRNVYAGERRWEFSAFIGGEASFTVHDDGSAELRAFGDQTGAKPFWREIEVLRGTRNANGTSGGTWSCASLELFEPGFPDTEGTATGTWLLVPVD